VACFALGKRLQRERYGQSYEPEEFVQRAAAYRAFFTADRLQNLPRAGAADGPVPVFLLGFARSGSSLLEQLLAQVAGFRPADGANPVSGLAGLVPKLTGLAAGYPEALADMLAGDDQKIPEELRYLAGLAEKGLVGPEQKFVTDRAADNFWHLGLIKLLFPTAPVVHVLRHPLDVMLSNLGQDRRLEGNAGVSMLAAARHYDLTMSMIRHFRGQLTLRYMPVRYEELVAAPGPVLRQVVGFVGGDPGDVPGEPALSANAPLPLRVAPAHAVVQEPVHARGVYRYRDYEAAVPALFAEVRPILAPWIEELGYAP
jgi:hypothetical protein